MLRTLKFGETGHSTQRLDADSFLISLEHAVVQHPIELNNLPVIDVRVSHISHHNLFRNNINQHSGNTKLRS